MSVENRDLALHAQTLAHQLCQVAGAKTAEPGAKTVTTLDSMVVWLMTASAASYGSLAGGWE